MWASALCRSLGTLIFRGIKLTLIRTRAHEARQVDKGCQVTTVSTRIPEMNIILIRKLTSMYVGQHPECDGGGMLL